MFRRDSWPEVMDGRKVKKYEDNKKMKNVRINLRRASKGCVCCSGPLQPKPKTLLSLMLSLLPLL
jgi:hypothetical protein